MKWVNKGYDKLSSLKTGEKLVLIAFILAFLIRFLLGPLKTGSYIDEYHHLLSGINILSEGVPAQVYINQEFYSRGIYISYLVASFFFLFGKTLFAARLVPLIFGLITIYLVYLISKRVMNNYLSSMLLVLMGFEPVMIFIHTYVREYVFVQFFSILSLLLLLRIRETIFDNLKLFLRKENILLIGGLIGTLWFCWNFIGGNKYAVYVVIGIFCSILIFELVYRANNISRFFKVSLSCILLAGFLMFLAVPNVQNLVFGRIFIYSFSLEYGLFSQYIVEFYGFLLIFFLAGIALCYSQRNPTGLYTSIIFLMIFFLFEYGHLNTPKGELAVRFIAFSFPFFFIISAKGLEAPFVKIKNYLSVKETKIGSPTTISFVILLIITFFLVYSTYPSDFDFFEEPSLPRPDGVVEVPYKDWGRAASYLKEYKRKGDILIAVPSQAAAFYNLGVDYTIIKSWHLKNRTTGYEDEELVYLRTNTPVIESTDSLTNIFEGDGRVWVLYSGYNLKRLGSTEINNLIKKETLMIEESTEWRAITLLLHLCEGFEKHNLVKDSGAEKGFVKTDKTVSRTTKESFRGNHSWVLAGKGTQKWHGIYLMGKEYEQKELEKDSSYIITYWAKNTATQPITIGIAGEKGKAVRKIPPKSNWTYYKDSFNSGSISNIRFQYRGNQELDGELYVDEIRIMTIKKAQNNLSD